MRFLPVSPLRAVVIAIALLGAPVAVTGGCAQIGLSDPAGIPGALPGEANELRVIRAAMVVRAGYDTVADQLEAGVITAGEAAAAKAVLDRAADAVELAEQGLALSRATREERLVYLEGLILDILRAQLAKAGD